MKKPASSSRPQHSLPIVLSVGFGLAVCVYISVAVGGLTAPAAMLGLVAMTAGLAIWQLVRALRLLVDPKAHADEAERRATGRRERELQREKQLILKALRELEFDYEMGKISDKDYREASANYRGRVAKIFRQLDLGGDYQKLVEEELAQRKRRRQKAEVGTETGTGTGTETATETETGSGTGTAAATADGGIATATVGPRVCAACSTPNDSDADYCKKCGKPLGAAS